jgi:hypothetical protein
MTEADIYLERGSEGIRYTTGKTAGGLCLCAAPGSIAPLAYAAVWPQLPLPSPKSSLRVMRDGQRKLRPKL